MTRRILMALFVAGTLLAGCMGDNDGSNQKPGGSTSPTTTPSTTQPQTPNGQRITESFDALDAGAVPAGWEKELGTWGAAENRTDTAHPKTMRGAGQADPGLSSLVAKPAGTFGDFEAEVSFQMLSGEHPQGAGMVFHWVDEENYQIIRYSISESGWHLFTMNDGNRNKESAATAAGGTSPAFGDWVNFRVVSENGHITAFDGATKVIDYVLQDADAKVGYVGLFTRGDTVTLFDNFEVEP